MTKKALAISLSILACLFLAALPAAAVEGPDTAGFFQVLYDAILEWIAPQDSTDDLVQPPLIPPAASTTMTPNQPEVAPYIPPGG